ncbi:MAG: InlB B-repeat-containing protein [Candidatus Gracilibacteria bacterium]|nr:InlB B-repeat-containing protein [Candidatus Gracilibacteria bacterium]
MQNNNQEYRIQNTEYRMQNTGHKQKLLNNNFYQQNSNKKAFTLVELIVVIVILAILGTIAFISYQGYSRNSRDSVRIADTNTIKKNLGIFVVETGFYPNPDNSVSILYSGATLWNQGTVGDTVIRNIENINKKPTDPLTNNEYTYSVANNRVEYQIGTIQENGGGGVAIITEKTYALGDSSTVAEISGNYNERILKVNTGGLSYILAIPSIITTEIITQEVQNILDNDSLVYDGYKNIPGSYANQGYTSTGGFDYSPTNIVVYSGTTINFDDNASKIVFMTNLKNAYNGTIIGSEEVYKDILNMNPQTEQDKAVNLVNNYITTNVGGISGKITTVVFKTCTLNGQILNHNQTITTYSENSILYGANYTCTDRSQERTCNDGTLSGDEAYSYTSCVKGEPTNCSANTSYTYNGHTYSIPAINHGQTATNIDSQVINISNGTQVYKLISIGCNDGVLVNETEEATPTVTCDSGYIQSGNNCIQATYTVSGSFGTNANGATINVCGTNTTADSAGNFTAIRNYGSVCNNITATRTGYNCTTTTNGSANLSSNITNIAGNCSASTYTVTFNANGGSLGTTSVTATYGSSMPTLATAPTYAGYTFNGYFNAQSGGTKYYNADKSSATTWNITSNITLYAQWITASTEYTLNVVSGQGLFNANGTIVFVPVTSSLTTKSAAMNYCLDKGYKLIAGNTTNTHCWWDETTTSIAKLVNTCNLSGIIGNYNNYSVSMPNGTYTWISMDTDISYSATSCSYGKGTLTVNSNIGSSTIISSCGTWTTINVGQYLLCAK